MATRWPGRGRWPIGEGLGELSDPGALRIGRLKQKQGLRLLGAAGEDGCVKWDVGDLGRPGLVKLWGRGPAGLGG